MSRSIRRHKHNRNSRRVGVFVLFFFLSVIALAMIIFRVTPVDLREHFSSFLSKPSESQSSDPPVSTPVPTPVPDPIFFPGENVVVPPLEPLAKKSDISFSVDGKKYSFSTYYLFGNENCVYVKLSELSEFLNSQMIIDPATKMYSLTYLEKTVVFFADTQGFVIDGDAILSNYASVPFNVGSDLYVPVEDVLSAFYPAHYANEEGNINFSEFSNSFPLQSDRDIPIISYYSVTDDPEMEQYLVPSESVFPSDFSEQLQFIIENGYSALRFEDLANLSNITKPVMLTFDGCWMDLYTVVFPLVKQYNIPINVFVWPDYLDTAGHITKDQLKELAASDLVSVQAGSEIYTAFDTMPKEEVTTRVLKAKSYVSGLIGREPLAFSYPAPGASTTAQEFCSSEFRFCLSRYGERPYNTTTDDGAVIYRYAIARGMPVAMVSYWLSRAK